MRRVMVGILVAALIAGGATPVMASGRPDLVVLSVGDPPPNLVQGESAFSVTAVIKNRSRTARTRSESDLTFFLSSDASKDVSDAQIASIVVPKLRPRKKVTGLAGATVPNSITPGDYFLIACVDTGNTVPEKNETNNCKTSTNTTQVTTCTASPNSSFASATTLAVGTPTPGELCPNESDFYKITTGPNQTLTITVTPGPTLDIRIRTYDSAQNPQQTVDQGFDGQAEVATVGGVAAGTWYIQLDVDPTIAGQSDTYQILAST